MKQKTTIIYEPFQSSLNQIHFLINEICKFGFTFEEECVIADSLKLVEDELKWALDRAIKRS
jgi:hypothetical protein